MKQVTCFDGYSVLFVYNYNNRPLFMFDLIISFHKSDRSYWYSNSRSPIPNILHDSLIKGYWSCSSFFFLFHGMVSFYSSWRNMHVKKSKTIRNNTGMELQNDCLLLFGKEFGSYMLERVFSIPNTIIAGL